MNFLKSLNKLHYLSAWCCCIFMLQRIYFFPRCSKPSLQIFCKSTIIKSQKKYQGGKVYSVSTYVTAAKVINKNIQCCDMVQACTVWDRAFNVCMTFQNVPPLLNCPVHAIQVEIRHSEDCASWYIPIMKSTSGTNISNLFLE